MDAAGIRRERKVVTAEATAVAGPSDGAEHLSSLLAPWAGQLIVVGAGAACLGAADHYLGILAGAKGDLATARALLLHGRAQHEAVGAPLLVARSDRALAGFARFAEVADARPGRSARRHPQGDVRRH